MLNRQGDLALIIYLFISMLFMDTIFKASTINEFYFGDTIRTIVFLLFYVFVIYLIASMFHGNTQFGLTVFFLSVVAVIYSSQLIYYKFFRTFYSFYSVSEGLQVMDFWSDIVFYLWKYSSWILLLFAPVIILFFFGRRYFLFLPSTWASKGVLLITALVIHLVGVGIVHIGGKDQHSAYDLYYKSNFPQISMQRLGLLTTMRLDIQRYLTDWSPVLDVEFAQPDLEDTNINNNEKVHQATDEEGKTNEDNNQENETEEEPEIEYNVLDIDFDQLIAEEENKEIKEMHQYFAAVEPSEKNDYTGKYEGYNLILLTAESFAPYAVHKEKTPTLYKLIHEGYRFTNFYTPIWEVSTSDGEYVALNSLLPKSNVWSFKETGERGNLQPFVLGHQLRKLGYETKAYHNHTYTYYGRDITHPHMGYDYKGLGNGLDVEETWPESDLEMMEKSVHEYIDEEPFHAYYMTVSGHMLYTFTGNYIAWKNRDLVSDLPYSDQAKAYIATHIELDRALKYILDQLEEKGIADRTLIALSSDHYPYGLDDETINELVGHTVEENFELYKNEFILYTKGMEPKVIDTPASSLDILPTLSNLLGLEYDSRLMMGKDIFAGGSRLIPFSNRSFITDKGKYNSVTQEFKRFDGSEVSDAYIQRKIAEVQAKFYFSAKILDNDYYRKVFPEE